MQDIWKAQTKTVEIDSNKSVTKTNVNGVIVQVNTKTIRPLTKGNLVIFYKKIQF